jgi:sterol desaturase/sphingolipid hydroxylase (fatty acid hydroxylase superfamily)
MTLFPKPSSESPPMFESALVDKFSRTHWSVVPTLYVPAAIVTGVLGVVRGVSLPLTVAVVLAGFFVWTLTEYWLHRLFFHWTPPGRWGERMHFLVHGVHHKWPRDRFRLVMPPAVSITLFWVFIGLFLWSFGDLGFAFHAGFTLGYVYYDTVHYYIHHRSPRYEWQKKLRRHHLAHHSPRFQHDCKFGVSTTLWDHVFRTYGMPAEPGARARSRKRAELDREPQKA